MRDEVSNPLAPKQIRPAALSPSFSALCSLISFFPSLPIIMPFGSRMEESSKKNADCVRRRPLFAHGPRVPGRETPRRQVLCYHNLVAKRQKTGILRSLLTLTLTASESCAKTRGNSPHRRMGKHGKSSAYVAHGSANATYAAPAGDFGSRPLLAAMTTNWRPSIM